MTRPPVYKNNFNRWYDAGVGRWLSEDPIGFAAGDSNLYRYVGNSPANSTDPTGNYAITWVDTFTATEKKRINDSLARLTLRIEKLLFQTRKELEWLDGRCKCEQEKLWPALRSLQKVLASIRTGIKSKYIGLEIYRRSPVFFHRDAEAWAETNDGRFWLTLNDNLTWATMDNGRLDNLIFHELSHFYGTEHEEFDNTPTPFLNAFTLSKMSDLRFNATYLNLRSLAAKACKDECDCEK